MLDIVKVSVVNKLKSLKVAKAEHKNLIDGGKDDGIRKMGLIDFRLLCGFW